MCVLIIVNNYFHLRPQKKNKILNWHIDGWYMECKLNVKYVVMENQEESTPEHLLSFFKISSEVLLKFLNCVFVQTYRLYTKHFSWIYSKSVVAFSGSLGQTMSILDNDSITHFLLLLKRHGELSGPQTFLFSAHNFL